MTPRIMVIAAVVLLVICVGGYEMIRRHRRPFMLAKAHKILRSLRGENDFLQRMARTDRVWMLRGICDDADITLEELGTSVYELHNFCKYPPKKFKK